MDLCPMKFISDVSLAKDDKRAMRGKQITAGKLIGLKSHCNANYATKERNRLKSNGWYAKVSRPKSICIYFEISIHLDISIQNISLVLSCESHPKCKSKAIYNNIKRTLRKVNNPCIRKYKHRCFPLVATKHPLVSCFCHSS